MKKYCPWCCQSDDYQGPRLADGPPENAIQSLLCLCCNRPILLVDVNFAAFITKKSPKTIYEWIKLDKAKTMRLADNRVMICFSSLFLPPG